MMLPWRGRVWGTQIATRTSPSRACSRMRSSSSLPPSVSLATTRSVFMRLTPPEDPWASVGRRVLARAGGLRHLGAALEHAVDGAGDAVLVGAADDRRDRVEVEDRRRGRALPLERERAPRVRCGARPATP